MKDLSKAIAILCVWAGISFLSYIFLHFGIMGSVGAAWMVVAGIIATAPYVFGGRIIFQKSAT